MPQSSSTRALQSEVTGQEAVDALGNAAQPNLRRVLDDRRARLDALGKLLESTSYERVLDRGFAVVLNDAGDIVRRRHRPSPASR